MLYKNSSKRRLFRSNGFAPGAGLCGGSEFSAQRMSQKCSGGIFADVCTLTASVKQDRKNLNTGTEKNIPEIYRGCIVFDYFLRAKKRYSQLNFNPGK